MPTCSTSPARGRHPPRATPGADDRNRTGDLVLTKDALCRLSYIGLRRDLTSSTTCPQPPEGCPTPLAATDWLASRSSRCGPTSRRSGAPQFLASLRRDSLRAHRERRLERETGIEPATNSLEGCDSTTELLPPSFRSGWPLSSRHFGEAGPPSFRLSQHELTNRPTTRLATSEARRLAALAQGTRLRPGPQGPNRVVGRGGFEPPKALGRQIYSLLHLTALQPPRPFRPWPAKPADEWSWRRDLNPRPADYKSAALPG
jgi:hypothetical protein